MSAIEDQIRTAIDASGRTAVDIAGAAGIHEVMLSRFRTGSRGVTLDTLEKIAAALGLEIALRPLSCPARKSSKSKP